MAEPTTEEKTGEQKTTSDKSVVRSTGSMAVATLMSRITGWTAHIIEQFENNSLIRPLSAYNGPEERHVER